MYSAVGQAGASGYIAALALFGFAPAVIKPTALILNVLVAAIATYHFWRAGHFSWSLFWPFAALSIPGGFVGGYLLLPAALFRSLLGLLLLVAATRLLLQSRQSRDVHRPSLLTSLAVGGGIGFVSGATATGGGILLTPLLVLFRWADTKGAAAVAAAFILVNSIAALLGHIVSGQRVIVIGWQIIVAAIIGGVMGARLGSKQLPERPIRFCLATVLAIAGLKLLTMS